MSACSWTLVCAACGQVYPGLELRYRCGCGGTLDVVHDLSTVSLTPADLPARRASKRPLDRSGVWRFRELILPLPEAELERAAVTRGEGNTWLHPAPTVAAAIGLETLLLKHEGENPTGSFKDRGMTVGTTIARHLGKTRVA